jgi:hypothetical protein
MKHYRVKVTERHSDIVWVEASSRAEALSMAPAEAECEFECVYDCEILEESDNKTKPEN